MGAWRAGAFVVILVLPGCTSLSSGLCLPPSQPMVRAELLFGRNIGERLGVSEVAFARFVTSEITPRFPDGFTIVDTRGQYCDDGGRLVREPGKLVLIVFADDPGKRAALGSISSAYKSQFNQQSVLSTMHETCARF